MEVATQLNSTTIYGRRCKTPPCPHLSSHFCISSTLINSTQWVVMDVRVNTSVRISMTLFYG